MSQNAVERTVGSPDEDLDLLEALRDRGPAVADRLVSAHGERAYRLAARMLLLADDDGAVSMKRLTHAGANEL